MSYYSSKHPGLYLYMALVTISVASFLFINISPAHIGILAILWGTYTALRTLTLYEMSEFYNYYAKNISASKNHNAQSSALAHDLVHRLTSGNRMKRGMLALYCLNDRTILWFALALAYTAYNLHLSTGFLTKGALMESMCTFFMIGAAFWAGQSYAYSIRVSRLLIAMFGGLLCLSLFTLRESLLFDTLYPALTGFSLLSASTSQTILVVLVLYSTAMLLYGLTQRKKSTLSILTGISLVLLLAACHVMLGPSQENTALWISGWGLFSIFWMRSFQGTEKRYVVYQCE